jgi:EAL domain-containing protein (putative c-di-GMP-specific phosphodiesterase class I)
LAQSSVATAQNSEEDRFVADLAGAVGRGEISAYYQPQIDVRTGKIVGVESLSRWQHPELGMQSPQMFIPIAEAFDLIDGLGDFMIEDAWDRVNDFAERGLPVDVAVNVSAVQLAKPSFFTKLEQTVKRLSPRAGALTLEITESRFIANRPSVAQRLGRLRDLGFGVSIDDFGIGHSSVEQILALPANELKIDRTIVQDEAATNGALMATIIALVRDRGMRTAAEGIETVAQLERVRNLGCDRAQGYLIGMPMPLPLLNEMLTAQFG